MPMPPMPGTRHTMPLLLPERQVLAPLFVVARWSPFDVYRHYFADCRCLPFVAVSCAFDYGATMRAHAIYAAMTAVLSRPSPDIADTCRH